MEIYLGVRGSGALLYSYLLGLNLAGSGFKTPLQGPAKLRIELQSIMCTSHFLVLSYEPSNPSCKNCFYMRYLAMSANTIHLPYSYVAGRFDKLKC